MKNTSIFYHFFLFILLCTTYTMSQAREENNVYSIAEIHNDDTEFDDYMTEMDELDQLGMTEWSEDEIRLLSKIPPFEIVEALIKFGVQKILLNDLYLRTDGGQQQRSLQDLPAFNFHFCLPYGCTPWWQVIVHNFYNQTTHIALTKEKNTIRNYINLDQPNVIQILDDFELGDQVPEILSLVGNSRIDERRTGVMLEGHRGEKNWYFSFKVPVFYQERNFILTNQERRRIEELLGPADMDFVRNHLISDKIGLGDTRLTIGFHVTQNPCHHFDFGFFSTIPTNIALKRGLFGNYFPPDTAPPPFSLLELFDLVSERKFARAQELLFNFLLGTLDKLSSNLLERPLGYERHFGLGIFMDSDIFVSNNLDIETQAYLEYILPGKEERFFIQKKTAAEFLDRDYGNEALADENLAFLNEQIILTLFPCVYKTIVFPGFIFRFNSAFTYSRDKFKGRLGYNLWWQQQEALKNIRAPQLIQNKLRKGIATRPGAIQHKLFGALNWHQYGNYHEWCISLQADGSFLSSGIGDDFNVSLRFEINV